MFPDQFLFGVEVLLNGLMAGVLYALVALGFVLIFKASGIFNYAQGVMALFAALTLVGIMDGQVPFSHLINAIFGTDVHHFGWHVPPLRHSLAMAVMVGLAWVVQHFVFRHLVGQEPIILFMATIGLAYFMEGFGDMMWGSEIKKLDVGIPQGGSFWIEEATAFLGGSNFYGFFIDQLDIVAAVVAIILVVLLVAFAQYTKQGRAMRAVADDHQAALSVGISLKFYLGLGLVAGGFCRSCGRHHVGREIRRAVLIVPDRAQSLACVDAWRVHFDPWCDCRRIDCGCWGKTVRIPYRRALFGWRDGELVRLHAGPSVFGLSSTRLVWGENH